MKLSILPFLYLLLCTINVLAQNDDNLVINGDFELLDADSLIHNYLKPSEFNTQMQDWRTPSNGSTDVLNDVFSYKNISLQPQNGKYAIGMVVNAFYSEKEKKMLRYYEYAQSKLKTPLKPNKKYLVKFDICGKDLPMDTSQYFGINLNVKKISNYGTSVMTMTPQVKMRTALDGKWQTVREIITPQEAYEYITIGYFDGLTHLKQFKYAVDNVIIVEVTNSENAIAAYLDFMGESVTLSDVRFNSNSSELLPISFPELDKAVKWLEQHPEYLIEIQGHTDDKGEPENNLKLSEQRAKSVYQYLVDKGILPYQIQQKGYGEAKPIANNETEDGRAINRRVMLKKVQILSSEDLYAEVLKSVKTHQTDEAFSIFQRMSKIGDLPIQLLIDQDLLALHTDDRWEANIKTTISRQYKQSHRLIKNMAISFELGLMLLENQALLQHDSIFWKNIRPFDGDFQPKKQDLTSLNKKQSERLTELFNDAKVLPGRFDIGTKGILAIFTIVKQSNDLAFQKEWLTKMEQSIKRKPEYKNTFAFLTDKIAMLENRPQVYGTQRKNGEMYQVKNPENLNKRRKSMNLSRVKLNQ